MVDTDFAFFEVHKVTTIMSPAINRNKVGVFTLPVKSAIRKVAGSAPGFAIHEL